jgi:hypothetical protein
MSIYIEDTADCLPCQAGDWLVCASANGQQQTHTSSGPPNKSWATQHTEKEVALLVGQGQAAGDDELAAVVGRAADGGFQVLVGVTQAGQDRHHDGLGDRHFRQCRDASFLGCFTEPGCWKSRRPLGASSYSARRMRSLGLPELRKTPRRGSVASSVLSSPLSSQARRSLPLRRQSTPSARTRSATWRLRRGSPRR